MFLAWGFANGFTSGRHSVAEAAARAKAAGYEWAALELDDPETSAFNLNVYPEFLAEWRARGMLAGGWTTEGGNIGLVPSSSDLAIAEVEGPGDLEGLTNVILGVPGYRPLPRCSLAIVTNFSTLTRDNVHPLLAAGFSCLTEAYMNANPNADPDGLDRMARALGWPTSQPVAGVYPVDGQPVPSYEQWADWPMADYLGEYVL